MKKFKILTSYDFPARFHFKYKTPPEYTTFDQNDTSETLEKKQKCIDSDCIKLLETAIEIVEVETNTVMDNLTIPTNSLLSELLHVGIFSTLEGIFFFKNTYTCKSEIFCRLKIMITSTGQIFTFTFPIELGKFIISIP